MDAMDALTGPDRRPTADLDDDALAAMFATPADVKCLDCAAHGPRLRSVHAAALAAVDAGRMPWRAGNDAWLASIERVRALAADLFDGDPEGVAMLHSVGHAMSLAARNLPLERGESVLVLDAQFPSNLLPWQHRCAQVGARVVRAVRRVGQDWTGAVLDALEANPSVRIAALPHAHWHDGALLDMDAIAGRCRARGIALVLDLSQSLGVLRVDIDRWQPQFVASVGHKWLLGGYGLAWLWVAPHWRRHGEPLEQHWFARDHDAAMASPLQLPPFRDGARRFDAGAVAHGQLLAMAEAALGQLKAWGVDAVHQALARRTGAFDAALHAGGAGDWSTPGHAPHVLGLRPPRDRLDAVAAALSQRGAVFTQRHGVLRIAPYLQVTVADMHGLARAAASAR